MGARCVGISAIGEGEHDAFVIMSMSGMEARLPSLSSVREGLPGGVLAAKAAG